jgi:hypothetical protein
MTEYDAPRLRELTKMMASENDPARLRVLAEELKTIVAKQGPRIPRKTARSSDESDSHAGNASF